MVKIYKVKPDTDYRLMYPEDGVFDSDDWEFKCSPLIDKLPQFKAYFDKESKKPIPDIAYIGMATFAFRHDVAEALVDILESAGEVLPFFVDEEIWYCLNVMACVDALDESQSEYQFDDGKTKLNPTKFVFNTNKLSESSLFKIPSDNHTNIFCADRRDTDEHVLENFLCAVAGHGFVGVNFEEVYSDE